MPYFPSKFFNSFFVPISQLVSHAFFPPICFAHVLFILPYFTVIHLLISPTLFFRPSFFPLIFIALFSHRFLPLISPSHLFLWCPRSFFPTQSPRQIFPPIILLIYTTLFFSSTSPPHFARTFSCWFSAHFPHPFFLRTFLFICPTLFYRQYLPLISPTLLFMPILQPFSPPISPVNLFNPSLSPISPGHLPRSFSCQIILHIFATYSLARQST